MPDPTKKEKNASPEVTQQDTENALIPREVADRQEAEYME